MTTKNRLYIAIDGDNVGRTLENYLLNEDFGKIIFFSKSIESFFEKIKDIGKKYDSRVILFGGDSVILEIDHDKTELFLKETSSLKAEITISIGIGDSIKKAYFSLKEAKALGRNRTVWFNV